jgi:hypothetical protein
MYRSTGIRFKKVTFEYSFYYTQEKLFFKHTTHTFRFLSVADHRQKKNALAFTDIRFFVFRQTRHCLKQKKKNEKRRKREKLKKQPQIAE